MLLASKKNNNRIPTRFENVSSARRRLLIPIRSVSFRSINKMRLLDLLSLSCLHLLWSIWNLIVVSLFLLAACRTLQSVDRRVYFRVVRFKIFGCSCRSWFKFWLCRTKNTRRENSFIRQRNKRKNLKKNAGDWEENLRWRLSGYGGQEIYETAKWQMPQTPATNTHTYSSIMQMPQWKIFLWHLWRRTHFRWQTSWTNRVVPNWPSKNGFKFTRQPEMGTGQGRTGGGEGGAQQQLSRVCVCDGQGVDDTKFTAYLNQSYKRAFYRSH